MVTYLQRAEDIIDFLIVEAMQAMQEFESITIWRETRNDLNRANNAEMANIQRTVTASMKTINNISKLWIWSAQVASLRLARSCLYPDEPSRYSIQQIADSLQQPISKSGVNHRLRKITRSQTI